ncbi:uncharacterized protein LOC116247804 isoform X1 [Nymphaea colorata]|nr:uncharacterized protein LOC116247804 isoform X1 [Nymphaea colorata]
MANSSAAAYFKPPHLFVHQKPTSHLSTLSQFTRQRLRYPRPLTNLKILGRSSLCRRKHDFGGGRRVGVTRFDASADDGTTLETESQASPSFETGSSENRKGRLEDGYVGLFVRMLGLDNDPLDREQAINALWKYSLGGKECIDEIMKFPGCINLAVSLLKSESKTTSEAAAGLLRSISAVNLYRTSVSAGGAIEEITGLLSRSVVCAEQVKEQAICTLWNLSVDEHLRVKISNSVLLPALIKCLDDEDIKVKEASGGVLANLALSQCNHGLMVEEGIILKLAEILKCNEGSKVVKKEARNILSELAKDDYYRILIVEAGLILVPIIGAAAYKSLTPASRSWPSLPDGTEFERYSSVPSRFGASELLLGLNVQDEDARLEEAQKNAIVGRTTQQFLARLGAIDTEEGSIPDSQPTMKQQSTFLPWIDGVARLVLILGLEDVSALERAALSIADACINEHMRVLFKEAGALKNLVRLLEYDAEAVRLAAAHALEKLSISNVVCQAIASCGAMDTLVDILVENDTSEDLLEKILDIVSRFLDPVKEMKSMFDGASFHGVKKGINGMSRSSVGTSDLGEKVDRTPLSKEDFREKVLESGVIPKLVAILKGKNPNLQQKAAIILENLADDEPYTSAIVAADVQSGLSAIFLQRGKDVSGSPEPNPAVVEESGRAISAASRLFVKLLSLQQCQSAIDTVKFIRLLHDILKSDVPLYTKDWVAACLIKLESLAGPNMDLKNPINKEVILHGTIPRLIEEIESSESGGQEEAVVELNHIISEGAIEYAREIAARGGIFPLVKAIDEGGERTREAGLAILYNLSMDSENHAAIVAAGAIPVLRRIVFSEGPQWMRALQLLRTLPT